MKCFVLDFAGLCPNDIGCLCTKGRDISQMPRILMNQKLMTPGGRRPEYNASLKKEALTGRNIQTRNKYRSTYHCSY